MTNFQAIVVEGLFYERGPVLSIEDDDGNHLSVAAVLAPILGQQVQFTVTHLPPHGIELDQPGAGSCRYPGGVGCPVGHDKTPTRLLTFTMEGTLRADPWRIEKFDGTATRIPFEGMPGHFGRIASATIVDVEAMREHLSGMDAEALSAAGVGADELADMLEKLKRTVRES